LVNRTGWWGNKYAVQTGIKYIDVAGINNLDIQGEFNLARPFMYTSYSDKQTFSNFGQFLGHPLGANFYELLGLIRYQPLNRLNITAKIIYSLYGNDTNGSNFGKDITLSYRSNSAGNYNNFIGQGVETKLLMGDLMATYMPKHNLFVDFKIGYRRTVAALSLFNQESFYLSLGLRLNINYRNYDF